MEINNFSLTFIFLRADNDFLFVIVQVIRYFDFKNRTEVAGCKVATFSACDILLAKTSPLTGPPTEHPALKPCTRAQGHKLKRPKLPLHKAWDVGLPTTHQITRKLAEPSPNDIVYQPHGPRVQIVTGNPCPPPLVSNILSTLLRY